MKEKIHHGNVVAGMLNCPDKGVYVANYTL
jgi:hypothetical protein